MAVWELNENNLSSLDFPASYDAWSGVRFYSGDVEIALAGDTSGRVLEIECPWGTREMADAILSRIRGEIYQPFSASDALLYPETQIGDMIILPGAVCPIVRQSLTLDGLFSGDISAPGEEKINNKFPVKNYLNLAVKQIIDSKIPDIESDNLRETKDEINQTIGDTIIMNQAATDALYAQYGDFSDIVTDRLSTSRRIAKYLAGDASDDNFIKIQGENLQFIAGICNASANPVQAQDPNGLPLYWKSNPDPNGAGIITGANGYPIVYDESGNAVPVFTTTNPTEWIVRVYQYTNQIKREISFELESAGNNNQLAIYSVTDTYGAGNQSGTNQLKIRKSTEGAEILYTPNVGGEIGIKLNNDGTMDIIGYEFIRKIQSENDLPDDWASQNRIFVIEN